MLKNDTGRVGILDATDPGSMELLSSVWFNHTVDLDTISVDGIPYAMVLNHTGIHMLDLADPASPVRAATIPHDSTHRGAIAATVRDGILYMSHINPDTWDLLNMSAPSDPQTVRTAGLVDARMPTYGAEWSGDTLLGSFSRSCLHILDTGDMHVPVFRPLHAADRQATVIIEDTPLIGIAATGDAPGLAIADTTPETFGIASFTPTNGTIDIGAVNLYGIPYLLLTTSPDVNNTSHLLVFDVRNATEPVLERTIVMSGEVRLDTATIDGSAYVVLLDSAGAAHAIRLDTSGPAR